MLLPFFGKACALLTLSWPFTHGPRPWIFVSSVFMYCCRLSEQRPCFQNALEPTVRNIHKPPRVFDWSSSCICETVA